MLLADRERQPRLGLSLARQRLRLPLHLRPAPDAYLSPWQPRDVIETPLEGELDVNGWDLGKALKLLLKGNAVVIEWLTSPIVYRGDPAFRDELLAFAARDARRRQWWRTTTCTSVSASAVLHFADACCRAAEAHVLRAAPSRGAALAAIASRRRGRADALPDADGRMRSAGRASPPSSPICMARKAVTRELGAAPLPEPIGHSSTPNSRRPSAFRVAPSPITRHGGRRRRRCSAPPGQSAVTRYSATQAVRAPGSQRDDIVAGVAGLDAHHAAPSERSHVAHAGATCRSTDSTPPTSGCPSW